MSNERVLTVEDVITAFIEEAKFRGAHEDLMLYHGKKLDLLKQLFRCDLEKRKKELGNQEAKRNRIQRNLRSSENLYEVSGEGTLRFFEHCIAALCQNKSPFNMGVYLERAHEGSLKIFVSRH